MTIRTRVAVTADELSPGVPSWGPNSNISDLLPDQKEIAIENLVSGRRYYVKTWNEDQFGNRSPEVVRVVNTPTPTKEVLMSLSAQGVLDDGSPMYAYVKVPTTVQAVLDAKVTLAFRQFMAPAKSAASSGSLTSDSGGGSTSGASSEASSASGGSSTPTSGASSASSSAVTSEFLERMVDWHIHPGGVSSGGTGGDVVIGGEDHSHGIAHTHVVIIGTHSHAITHTHDTPDHDHSIPGHVHVLVYGTFEETYPTSHSVTVKTYKRVGGSWTLVDTQSGLTDDLEDIDLSAVITGPGDWRIQAQSDAGQPNEGRLGCDLYGAITATV